MGALILPFQFVITPKSLVFVFQKSVQTVWEELVIEVVTMEGPFSGNTVKLNYKLQKYVILLLLHKVALFLVIPCKLLNQIC